jgi:hypothetical protein
MHSKITPIQSATIPTLARRIVALIHDAQGNDGLSQVEQIGRLIVDESRRAWHLRDMHPSQRPTPWLHIIGRLRAQYPAELPNGDVLRACVDAYWEAVDERTARAAGE